MVKNMLIALLALSACKLQAQIPNYVPANGLMGYWPFSGNANDVSGNSYNGTVSNATLTSDRFNNSGSAYFFNGSGTIQTPYAGILGTNPRAVSFWARTSHSVSIMSAVAWGDDMSTAARYEAGFNYGGPGPMLDGGNGVITYSPPVPAHNNQWHHYVMQFGASSVLNQVQVYQDGVLLAATTQVYNGTNILNTVSVFNVRFGSLPGSPQHYFFGALDDIGIWNRPLTVCEIDQLYKASALTATVNSTSGCSGPGSATVTTSGLAGPYSYTWLPAGGSGSVATNLSNGAYSVAVSTTKQCKLELTFTVTAGPGPTLSILGPGWSCPGTQVTLHASGAQSYTWFPGNAQGSSHISYPTSSTVYTLAGTAANGCTNSLTYAHQVIQSPTITVSGPGSICANTAATLVAQGGSTYTWLPGSTVGSQLVVSPASSTTYTVYGAGACDSTYHTTSHFLNVLPLPVISITANIKEPCSGDQVIYSASGGIAYSWQPVSSNSSTLALITTSTTTITVVGTGSNGCSASTTLVQQVRKCLSVPETELVSIRLWPNPSRARVYFEGLVADHVVSVFSMDGRMVGVFRNVSTNIELSYLPAGLYTVQVEQQALIMHFRLILE